MTTPSPCIGDEALPPIHTVGHSTRSMEEFVNVLRSARIDIVVDVRTVPRSRTNPQFNKDVLPESLLAQGIDYIWLRELGGLRGASKVVPAQVNAFWNNASFRNYADYALGPEFASGLSHLLELASARRAAIMCSEAVWWRCHRRIIADYLIHRGRRVCHLMGVSKVEPAAMNPAARPEDGRLAYPAPDAAGQEEMDFA